MSRNLKAVAFVILCLLIFGWLVKGANAETPVRTIYVANASTKITDAQIINDLPAFQAGLDDLERYWGGNIQLAMADANTPATSEIISVTDSPNCMCYGYHDVFNGVPFGIVGTDGNWTITFTHELFEEAVDPYIHRTALGGKRFWLVEVGDPVERDTYAYTRPAADGTPVKISDFVTDRWYRTGARSSGGRIDFAGHLHYSMRLLPGGYVSYWGYSGGHADWQQIINYTTHTIKVPARG